MVGIYLAQLLNVPAVTLAREVTLHDNKIHITRVLPDGYEIAETTLPALVTVGSEVGELRNLNMKKMREVKKKPALKWSAADFPLAPQSISGLQLISLVEPKRERKCLFIEAETPAEAGEELAVKLREDKVI
jgi:electron transfer flavoprotein beta subunit